MVLRLALKRLPGNALTRAALLAVVVMFPAFAAEIHVKFGALERMLGEQLFSQEGRYYVKGSRANRCNFAYLERPAIAADAGRLVIRARFSGRSSLNIAGQCVGLGDAFDLVIRAVPQYKDGSLRFQEVKVTSAGKTGYYIRRVCTAMEASLAKDLKYPLETEAKKTLEDPKRELRKFQVQEIRVSDESLVLVVDFELTVK